MLLSLDSIHVPIVPVSWKASVDARRMTTGDARRMTVTVAERLPNVRNHRKTVHEMPTTWNQPPASGQRVLCERTTENQCVQHRKSAVVRLDEVSSRFVSFQIRP